MIWAVLAAIIIAMLLVRLGWAGRRGAAPGGWALLVGGLTVLTMRDGAWGLAMGSTAAIVAAIAIVFHAGWKSPGKAYRAARETPSATLPSGTAGVARRVFVFVLVVPVALVAAQWLAFGIQALARRGGWVPADAIVLALFLQPVLWGVLTAWQMTRTSPAQMIVPPAGAAVLGTMLWGLA